MARRMKKARLERLLTKRIVSGRAIRCLPLLSAVLLAVLLAVSPSLASAGVRKTETAAAVEVGGAFEMVDHTGKPVTDKDYALRPKLMFFGFTHCPDVCPLGLQQMTDTLAALGEEQASRLYPLFITVDPARDTAEVMAAYIKNFSSKIIGLTGSEAQVTAMVKAYRVYAEKGEDMGGGDYLMNHSAFVYLMSPEGRLEKIFRPEDAPAEIADYIRGYLAGL